MSQADRANQESIAQAGAALNSQLDPLPGNLALERKTRVGSYSDVYMGIWTHNGEDEVVCIKCIRNTTPVTDLACPDLTREERFKRVCLCSRLTRKITDKMKYYLANNQGDFNLDASEAPQCSTISRLPSHRRRTTACLSMDG